MADSRLLKLKTDLKSLKFDPNNEPYILFPIGYTKSFEVNDNIPQSIVDFYNNNRNNPDFPLRGGTINVDPRTLTFTQASQIDRERIKKFLNDKPKGTVFLQKQVGLQLSNPKIETDGIIPGAFSGIENTRFYNNGINTLAQVGVQGTGLHAVRHGAIPFNPLQKGYYDIVNQQNLLNNAGTNRLLALKGAKLSNNATNRSAASRLGIAPGSQNLFQYLGGPDSVYGVGLTTIRRYDNTEQGVNRMAVGTDAKLYSDAVKRTYRQIDEAADAQATVSNGIQTYKTSDLSARYGVGDPGKKSTVSLASSIGTTLASVPIAMDRVDKLNANTLLYYNSNTAPWEVDSNIVYNKDIIKFVFEAIDNDNTSNSTAVFFRAFLSGITDNHNAAINNFRYLGRGEEYYTYQGVSRQIGFSFKINPQSAAEFRPLYKKLNYLISQVYPDYSQTNKIMRAPLMRLTIGDYFYRLPGLIETISITIDDNSPWEIESNELFKQLPHVINVQCTFKPIHDFLPRRESISRLSNMIPISDSNMNVSNVPFITDSNGYYVSIDDTKGDVVDNPKVTSAVDQEAYQRATGTRSIQTRPIISSRAVIPQNIQQRGLSIPTNINQQSSFDENNMPFGQ
jgi:hypothetical protein